MAEGSTGHVALMAIQPEYAERIFAGEKHVEFRRTRFRSGLRYVVVYASAPIKAVIGYFCVDGIDSGSPDEIWERFGEVAGIDEEKFRTYFAEADTAIAIRIGEVTALQQPLPIGWFRAKSPPQSFLYLSDAVLEVLEKRIAKVKRAQEPSA